MKISYAIPVCNEHAELEKLLDFLLLNIDEEDEIVVQCDDGNTTPEVYKVLEQFVPSYIEFPLNGHFSNFKNNLKKQCTGDWIFQIDADELPTYYLIKNLKEIIKCNPTVEMFMVPRINTVKGLTKEHIEKWGWRVDNNGWVNFPDYQTRIIQNSPKIKWQNKVHEQIVGVSKQSALPTEEPFCLYHPKNIEKQELQNNFYNTL
jgi:GT2 family glycosyltransferase